MRSGVANLHDPVTHVQSRTGTLPGGILARPDPYAGSIQCPLGDVTGCFHTTGGTPATLTAEYRLVPGVFQGYKVPAGDLGDYVPPVPPLKK